jgi:hypothetical protein
MNALELIWRESEMSFTSRLHDARKARVHQALEARLPKVAPTVRGAASLSDILGFVTSKRK